MTRREREYGDGEIIFREGDESDSAMVILDGDVELIKEGDGGALQLATLGRGEMFGEMGVLDGSSRSATARAVGTVRVEVIDRRGFLEALEKEPKQAMGLLGRLAKRLRAADDMLAHGGAKAGGAVQKRTPTREEKKALKAAKAAKAAGGRKPGLLARLFGFGGVPKFAATPYVEVRVATFEFDPDAQITKRLTEALSDIPGVKVRPLGQILELPEAEDPSASLSAATTVARQVLVRQGADAMIWGRVLAEGTLVDLRLTSAVPDESDRPGGFGSCGRIFVPSEFTPALSQFLQAMILAGVVPKSAVQAQFIRQRLPASFEAAMTAGQEMPERLDTMQQGLTQACYADVAVLAASYAPGADWHRMAEEAYGFTLGSFAPADSPFDWAMAQKNMGAALQMMAERGEDGGGTEGLKKAVAAYRAAIEVMPKVSFPNEWGTLQERLGDALYRLDLRDTDPENLKGALAAYQSALGVFTRNDAPLRWAEIMNSYAQVAQVLGGHLRNFEVLEKSIEVCRKVLEVRSEERTPLQWAATQNNLGSGLFLLSKLKRDGAMVEDAVAAFSEAARVYESLGAGREAEVARRNLSRAESAGGRFQSRDSRRPWWLVEEDDVEPKAKSQPAQSAKTDGQPAKDDKK